MTILRSLKTEYKPSYKFRSLHKHRRKLVVLQSSSRRCLLDRCGGGRGRDKVRSPKSFSSPRDAAAPDQRIIYHSEQRDLLIVDGLIRCKYVCNNIMYTTRNDFTLPSRITGVADFFIITRSTKKIKKVSR